MPAPTWINDLIHLAAVLLVSETLVLFWHPGRSLIPGCASIITTC
jgi:hypothetical protein